MPREPTRYRVCSFPCGVRSVLGCNRVRQLGLQFTVMLGAYRRALGRVLTPRHRDVKALLINCKSAYVVPYIEEGIESDDESPQPDEAGFQATPEENGQLRLWL